jgi:hypothetical protein
MHEGGTAILKSTLVDREALRMWGTALAEMLRAVLHN